MAVVGNYVWVFGGFSLSKGPLDVLARYYLGQYSSGVFFISLIVLKISNRFFFEVLKPNLKFSEK